MNHLIPYISSLRNLAFMMAADSMEFGIVLDALGGYFVNPLESIATEVERRDIRKINVSLLFGGKYQQGKGCKTFIITI